MNNDAEYIKSKFLEELNNQGIKQDDSSDLQKLFLKEGGINWPNPNSEIFLTKYGFLYVHVSTSLKGFWGLRKGILDLLDRLSNPPLIILLKSRIEDDVRRGTKFVADGYIISELGKPPMKRYPNLDSTENDYKINEPNDLDNKAIILSIQEIVQQIKQLPS